jgi:hypothetical protein
MQVVIELVGAVVLLIVVAVGVNQVAKMFNGGKKGRK